MSVNCVQGSFSNVCVSEARGFCWLQETREPARQQQQLSVGQSAGRERRVDGGARGQTAPLKRKPAERSVTLNNFPQETSNSSRCALRCNQCYCDAGLHLHRPGRCRIKSLLRWAAQTGTEQGDLLYAVCNRDRPGSILRLCSSSSTVVEYTAKSRTFTDTHGALTFCRAVWQTQWARPNDHELWAHMLQKLKSLKIIGKSLSPVSPWFTASIMWTIQVSSIS